jgi:hypothetical protein
MLVSEKGPISHFVAAKLIAGKQRAAHSTDTASHSGLYGEVARTVVAAFPALTATQKARIFGSFQEDARLTKLRAGVDTDVGLQLAAQIFEIGT